MTECFNKLTFARAWCAVYEDVDSATRSFEGMAKVGLQYVDEWLYMFVIIHAQFWRATGCDHAFEVVVRAGNR